MLELADYWRATRTLPGGVDWTAAVRTAWEAALDEVDERTGLMATVENAADDPVVAPFVAGSQILLWYTARRLEKLASAGALALDPTELRQVADAVRDAFLVHLVGADRWAYATDGTGLRVDYHDANDLPIALAPVWGFCAPDDPRWLATMRFAFSRQNPGFWDGPMPGLGSVHTPGAWSLGDVQAWLFAVLTADADAASTALARLDAVASEDGMLPEAYAVGGDGRLVRIRHWFAWPGAAFGAFWTLAQRGELRKRSAVAP
jgi:meiotically up-regulated gene 157 (Mug157) protein